MIRSKLRSTVKKSNSVRRASRMEDVYMRAVYREDRQREARAERRGYDREVNKTRSHHGKGRMTVFRREG